MKRKQGQLVLHYYFTSYLVDLLLSYFSSTSKAASHRLWSFASCHFAAAAARSFFFTAHIFDKDRKYTP
jgi:hypothetical protein